MKKTMLTVFTIAILSVLTIFAVVAITAPEENNPLKLTREELVKNEKILKENPNMSKKAASYIENNGTGDDLDLKEKREKLDQEEQLKDENDKKAYTILNKYCNEKLGDNLITDINEDYRVMSVMCNSMKTINFSNAEIQILKNYLSRRYDWIENDEEFKNQIKSVLENID